MLETFSVVHTALRKTSSLMYNPQLTDEKSDLGGFHFGQLFRGKTLEDFFR